MFGLEGIKFNEAERKQSYRRGIILAILFFLLSTLNLISILRSIFTSPGKVPEDVEFDMGSDTTSHTENE